VENRIGNKNKGTEKTRNPIGTDILTQSWGAARRVSAKGQLTPLSGKEKKSKPRTQSMRTRKRSFVRGGGLFASGQAP